LKKNLLRATVTPVFGLPYARRWRHWNRWRKWRPARWHYNKYRPETEG